MTVQEYAYKLRSNIGQVIKGKDDKIDLVLMAMLAGGHVLLEDVPGTGKTVLAKAIAKSIDADFSRIQFTPDLLPSDITGIHFFNMKEQKFIFRKGPVFANILLADEINRATPRTQSALLECMEERQATIDGETFTMSKPFLVIATENPVETSGTYPLPEAQLDRFLIKLSMGYADKDSEMAILDNARAKHPIEDIKPVTDAAELAKMSDEVDKVKVNDAVRGYIADIGKATRESSEIKLGLSTRGLIALKKTAQARAALRGRDYATPDDVQQVAPYVIPHRLICKTASFVSGGDPKSEAARKIISEVEVPTETV